MEELTDLLKLGSQFGISALIAIMVLKFLFKIIGEKFKSEQDLEQKNYEKSLEIINGVNNVAKIIDKINISQDKISDSQTKIVMLIESVDRKINGKKMG